MDQAQQPLSGSNPVTKPKIIIVASPRARSQSGSSLLRLVRDYSQTLKKYEIHTTQGTGQMISGTGMYDTGVVLHRRGEDGGVAQLAAIIARGECHVAIALLDPSDPWSNAAENWALKRVCIQRQVRLITTYAAAVRWATYEALDVALTAPLEPAPHYLPINWRPGTKNTTKLGDFQQPPVEQRSIALISHDKKKLEMVEFVATGIDLLAKHDRILTTGTTGSILKLLYSNGQQQVEFMKEVDESGKRNRLAQLFEDLLGERGLKPVNKRASLEDLLAQLRENLQVTAHEDFAGKIMPLPSGPEGGDELIAEEVLNNECHAIIFFHDPMTAHPHAEDIRLFERTCQLPGVFAECVSDKQSANRWLEELRQELSGKPALINLAQELRQTWKLQEVLVVKRDDNTDSEDLGTALARVCAGYINLRLQQVSQEAAEGAEVRVGVAWGWGVNCVLEQLEKMKDSDLLEKPALRKTIIWSPLIGTITAELTDQEAIMIAHGFCEFYGGKVEGIPCAGFARSGAERPTIVNEVIEKLRVADIVLTSASPWGKQASLYQNTGLDSSCFPRFEDTAGLVSGVFLDENGRNVSGEYSIVGLDWQGFVESARRGAVVLMAGGENRGKVILAALRGGLVSVLITTSKTAEWLLSQEREVPETLEVKGAKA